MSNECYLGLGSNLDDPARQIDLALQRIQALPGTRLLDVSPLFRTKPVGPQDQPDFINGVCKIETSLVPHMLLTALKQIELDAGRAPGRRWGERVIDLDILTYGNDIIDADDLKVPHPQLGKRGFVLVPLHAIAPELELADGHKVEVMYRTCDKSGVIYHGEANWRPAP